VTVSVTLRTRIFKYYVMEWDYSHIYVPTIRFITCPVDTLMPFSLASLFNHGLDLTYVAEGVRGSMVMPQSICYRLIYSLPSSLNWIANLSFKALR